MVSEGSELSAVVTEITEVTAGPEEASMALAKAVYAQLYEGNLSSRYIVSLQQHMSSQSVAVIACCGISGG